MGTLLAASKILLLIISFWGYYRLLRVQFGIKNEFCPSIAISSIGCVLFVFGCINLLVASANALLIGGVILFAYYTFVKKIPLKEDMSIGIGVFLALTVFLLIRLKDAHIYDCDNYNHWGLIIKNIMYDSKFPDGSDKIIRFTSYPTGSTVVIWYFLRLFKYTEAGALFFQDLFMMSCGIGFFAFIDKASTKRRAVAYFFAILGTLSMFTCDRDLFNGPFDLLVDQLLASVAVAAYLIIEYYKGNNKKAVWATLPFIVYEVTIKNSGILFTYALALILIYRVVKSRKETKSKSQVIIPTLVLLGVPLIVRKIWDLHVKMSFDDGGVSIHSVSVSNYKSIMADKTPEDIKTITGLYLDRALNMQNYIVCFVVILVIAYILFEYKKDKEKYCILSRMLYIIGVYLVYQIGLYCMYIFSMPVYEALVLPCYFRYIMTIDQFTFGIILVLLIKITLNDNFLDAQSKKSLFKSGSIGLATVLLLIYSVGNLLPLFIPREKTKPIIVTNYMQAIFDKYELPQDQEVSYLIYISDVEDDEFYSEFTDYKWHMATYSLYSANITTLRKSQLGEFNRLNEYDYFIAVFPDDDVKAFLGENNIEYEECICLKNE